MPKKTEKSKKQNTFYWWLALQVAVAAALSVGAYFTSRADMFEKAQGFFGIPVFLAPLGLVGIIALFSLHNLKEVNNFKMTGVVVGGCLISALLLFFPQQVEFAAQWPWHSPLWGAFIISLYVKYT